MGKGARRRFGLTWALALAAGLSVVATMGGAAATGDDTTQNVSRFAKIDPSLFESTGAHSAFVPASLSNRPVSVVMQLATAPVAVQNADAKQRGQKLTDDDKNAIRQQVQGEQDALHGSLAQAGANVVGQMQDAYNGIQVVVPQRNLAQLASLPGVLAIHAVQTFTPSNTNGVPFIGVPQAWQDFGVTGTGVKIAVIDTGIDYTHADFGGPGTVAAWNAAKAASTAPANPSLFGPAAPKVRGGYDFVGDAYNANTPGSVPVPDPNPLDCNGHGTHTAGTAAGFGVLSSGATFHGTYDASTITSRSWKVGPGVAPRASIYAYRVFGCVGSSDIVALAINRAVADHVDVISMSLGSPFGGTDDPTTVASQNAFNDGITVVASAGNEGSSAYMVGSPSTANGVLSVAAMDGSTATFSGGAILTLTKPDGTPGGTVPTINANGASLPPGPFPVKVLTNVLGCSPGDYTGSTGTVVITVRGTCARVARAVYGQKAGAVAVVMINTSPGYPPFEGQITSNPDTGEKYTVTIPFLGALQADGATLLAAGGESVTLTSASVPNPGYKTAASFTSGGPRNPDSAPKPDVIAPGISVTSAGMGTGTGSLVASGTSMACPMTAGVAALVKQKNPTWTGAQIKAAIMNTADPSLNLGYNSRLAGTGVVQAQKAVNSSVLARTTDSLDAIKFGYVPGSRDYSARKTFTLTNSGTSSATYNLSVVRNNGASGSVITLSPSSVSVASGATATVQVSLSMSAAAFAALPTDDTFSPGPGLGNVVTVRGVIVATPVPGHASQQTLRLPFMLVPRGLSNVVAGTPSKWSNTSSSMTSTLRLTNNGIHTGTADLYTWGISDPRETGQPMDVRAVGVQVLPGDLPLFGSTPSDRGLVFLINTWGQSTNQSINEFDIQIWTRADGNQGSPDFVVVGADLGAVLTGTPNGVFAAFTINVKTAAIIDSYYADAPMNGSTIELPTLASDFGLTAKDQGLTYSVNAFNSVPGGLVDVTGSASINPFSPPVSSGDFATLKPGTSASFPLTVYTNQQEQEQGQSSVLGWLIASVDNANGARQALEIRAPQQRQQQQQQQ